MANIRTKPFTENESLQIRTQPFSELNQPQLKKPQEEVPSYQWRPPGIFVPQNKSAIEERGKQANDAVQNLIGVGKSYGNAPTDFMNIFRQPKQEPFPYSNPAQEAGGVAGDVSQFMIPSATIGGAAKLGSMVPRVGVPIKNALNAIEKTPLLKNLFNILGTGLNTAVSSAKMNPTQSIGKTAHAGVAGSALQTVLNTVLSRNPMVALLARTGIGAGMGYLGANALNMNPYEGMGIGATVGSMAPNVLTEMGLSRTVPEEFLGGTNPQAFTQRVNANRLLGTGIRPSEAADSTNIAALEGNIPKTAAGSQEMQSQEAARVQDQKAAIKRMLDMIHPKTQASSDAISQAYTKAYTNNVPTSFIQQNANDPVIEAAENRIASNPVLQKGLQNIPKENLAYQDQVKRTLDDMEQSALRQGNNNEARIIGQTRNSFVKELDKVAPEYQTARQLSQREIVRNEIEDALQKGQNKEITGYNFFRKVVSNDDQYNALYKKLSNVPEAQQHLKAMKEGWDTLIPKISTRAMAKLTETNMTSFRSSLKDMIGHLREFVGGGERDVERAKFIYSKDWENEFNNIVKINNNREKRDAMIKFIGKSLGNYEINKN